MPPPTTFPSLPPPKPPAPPLSVSVIRLASTNCLGTAAGMSTASSGFNDDWFTNNFRVPFPVPIAGTDRGKTGGVFVGSNSYITFGGGADAYENLGPSNPPVVTVFIGSRDTSWSRVLYQDMGGGYGSPARFRLRWEGYNTFSPDGTPVVWEANFYSNNVLQLCIGPNNALTAPGGVSGVSNGAGRWLANFGLLSNSLYIITGLGGGPPSIIAAAMPFRPKQGPLAADPM